ncbi:gag/pol protein [Cucumis melo var. makuwa]|uniref:Gag/pol protein n=1 Tax=Cucumis melo var. makuwa TaxID=1194695 RepID=A0A5D3CSF2_CUCMM|nr:gag/pol protein [Cucumis melo var. makuwa]
MVTARQIKDSLREMFGQPSIQIKQEANVVHSRRFAPSSSGFEKIRKRKEGKGKGPTIAVEGKGKAKVAIKEKCFHCNVDEHWKTNCPKYLVKKKEKEGATNHVCSSLQETSSFKQLEESEMTLKVGTGDVISARAVGDAKYGYLYLMEHKSEALDESTRVVDEDGPPSRVDETTTSCQSHSSQTLRMPRRSGRVISQPNCYLGLTETQVVIPNDGVEDSLSYKQAMNDVDKDQWVKAMDLEMESMFDTVIKSYGFDQNVDEPCVYKKFNKGKVAFLVLYVDDILLIGNDVGYLTDIKVWLADQFQMKDLGGTICSWDPNHKDRKNKTLALSQATYIDKMLVRYLMQNSKKGLLPFRHGVHLSKEQCLKTPQEVEDMRRIPYASAMGSLMYAMFYTRPDICYAAGIVSRMQTLQMEAEYVATCEAAKEAVWLRKFLHDLEVVANMDLPITLYCDNRDVIVTKIASEHNIADPFTKTLTAKVFEGHLESLGLRDMYIRDCPLICTGESGQIVDSICLSFWNKTEWGAENIITRDGIHSFPPLGLFIRGALVDSLDVDSSKEDSQVSVSFIYGAAYLIGTVSFGITRLICASFGITRLICASFEITGLVRVWRGADRRGARRMREGHMDASGFLYASADLIPSTPLVPMELNTLIPSCHTLFGSSFSLGPKCDMKSIDISLLRTILVDPA